MLERDNLHLSLKYADSFNKQFILTICAREAGKTSSAEWEKVFEAFKNGNGVLLLYRYAKEVHKYTLKSIENRINQYLEEDEKIEVLADKEIGGGITTGIISFHIFQNKKQLPGSGLLQWIGLDDQILKKTYLKRPWWVIFDEYVLNPQSGERYIKNEFEKILLLLGTLTRYQEDGHKIRLYFLGNPSSKLNPFTEYFKIDLRKMKEGAVIVGPNYLVWCYKLKDELKKKLLSTNSAYEFDDSYKRFALDGVYVYDEKRINLLPNLLPNFKLDYVIALTDLSFKIRYIGIYYNSGNNTFLDYIVKEVDDIEKIRSHYVYSFSFKDMQRRTTLFNSDNIETIAGLRSSLCDGRVGFVNTFYYINDLFNTYIKKI